MLYDDLLALYVDDVLAPERCGFVLKGGTVVEVENICHEPVDGFDISGEDLLKYEDTAVASWHTHTGLPSNLTRDDQSSFLNYPDLTHYIIGSDGISVYKILNGVALLDHTHPPARLAEDPSP